jgi:hypothetical protein
VCVPFFLDVGIPEDHHRKLPKPGAEYSRNFSLTVWEVTGQHHSVAGLTPLEAVRESVLCDSQSSVVAGNPWGSLTYDSFTPGSASIFTCCLPSVSVSGSLLRMPATGSESLCPV